MNHRYVVLPCYTYTPVAAYARYAPQILRFPSNNERP